MHCVCNTGGITPKKLLLLLAKSPSSSFFSTSYRQLSDDYGAREGARTSLLRGRPVKICNEEKDKIVSEKLTTVSLTQKAFAARGPPVIIAFFVTPFSFVY